MSNSSVYAGYPLHREIGKMDKTQGILFAQVVSSLMLEVKDISILLSKFPLFF